jgi:hypothetical protein
MSQTEQALQEGLQDIIQALSDFSPADVTINDWDVLDLPGASGPFFIIGNSDDFSSVPGISERGFYEIPGDLIHYIADKSWKVGADGFRDARQAIRTTINAGDNSTVDGLATIYISEMRAGTPIGYLYQYGVDPELEPDAVPMYLIQSLIFRVEMF